MIQPTIMTLEVPIWYEQSLAAMVAAGNYGNIAPWFVEENFPIEKRESGRAELVLVSFNQALSDDADTVHSELIWELEKLGLEAEGPSELCALGAKYPNLQREFPIIARRQVWLHPLGFYVCPMLGVGLFGRHISVVSTRSRWGKNDYFLASRAGSRLKGVSHDC